MTKRRIKWILALVAVYLIAAAVAPRYPINGFRGPAQRALESELGRKAEIGSIRVRLLPLPGFTIENVTIAEDPSIGAEPIAYVTTMHATPGPGFLIGRPLSFSSVNLEDASLNLTRVDMGPSGTHWNFSTLANSRLLSSFPSIHLRGGRINFKFNDTKSVFYLLDTDVDLSPPATAGGEWSLSLRAQPARTDRPARGFGIFTAKGVWNPRENGVALDVKLEKSQLSEMLTLVNGQESGIYGEISGNAHLAGQVSRIGFAGLVNVANIHGWDQLPPGGGGSGNVWPLAVSGILNAPGQVLDLSASLNQKESPFTIHYRVSDYLRTPRWGVTANLKGFPLAPVTTLARNLGGQIPEKLKLEGSASGAVGYSLPAGVPRLEGEIVVTGAKIAVTGSNVLKIPQADLRFSGSTINLTETRIENATGESAAISASWDAASQHAEADLSSDGMSITALSNAGLRNQISPADIPLLSSAISGKWSGRLRYISDPSSPGQSGWHGDVHIDDAAIAFEAFAQPIHIASAAASINGASLDVKQASLSLGDISAQGEYHYDPAARRPHRFRLVVARADAVQIEKLLMPTLHRGSFISYAFNFGRVPEPDWLRAMHGDGTIQLVDTSLAGQDFAGVRARVLWDGDRIQLSSLAARMDGAAFSGSAVIQLAAREPVYTVKGTLTDLAWHEGSISTEASLTSSGTGAALLANLKASGSFHGRSVNLTDLAPLDVCDSVSGTFDWSGEARRPRLRLSDLVLRNGDATWQGAGELDDSGHLALKLSDGSRQIQATGGDSLKPAVP